MANFEYVALDRQGKRLRGLVEGDSGRQARQLLRESGLTLLSVQEVSRRGAGSARGGLFAPRLGDKALALFTRLLASLLQAGLPVDEALSAILGQSDSRTLRRLVAGVRGRVLEGHSLASALEGWPESFPEIYRATVAAGEQTRHLPAVLERLAQHMEERQALSQRLRLAMIYPAILVGTALLIVAGLLTYVVPEITRVFTSMERELPAITRALLWTSEAARGWGHWLLAGLLAAFVAARVALRRPGPRRRRDRLLLRLPLVRRLVREGNAARVARTLAILLQSGLPLVDALGIAARATTSLPIREALDRAAIQVREGLALHKALAAGGLLPPLLLHLVASGEAGGNLESMLEAAARTHEQEVNALVGTLLAVVEPALILLMGLLVLAIVIAILLPIFELNQMV